MTKEGFLKLVMHLGCDHLKLKLQVKSRSRQGVSGVKMAFSRFVSCCITPKTDTIYS